jgi:hypothetical protein
MSYKTLIIEPQLKNIAPDQAFISNALQNPPPAEEGYEEAKKLN